MRLAHPMDGAVYHPHHPAVLENWRKVRAEAARKGWRRRRARAAALARWRKSK